MARRHAILFLVATVCGWGCQKAERSGPSTLPAAAKSNLAPSASPEAKVPAPAAAVVSLRSAPMPLIFANGRTRPAGVVPNGAPAAALSPEEQNFLRATNEARTRRNLPVLRANPGLFELARSHAAHMARLQQTDYELDGHSLPKEVKARFPEQSYAMAVGSSGKLDCGVIVDSWLKDQEIRDQILDAEYEEAGIGIARDGAGSFYYVEIFQTPKR